MSCSALLWILMLTVPLAPQGKPQTAPVSVTYTDPPADMKTGDETTTTLTFKVREDVDELRVFLVADDGLEILSATTQAVFTNVTTTDTPSLEVRVKLTDPKGSTLNVSFATLAGDDEGVGAIGIDYGTPDHFEASRRLLKR